MTDSDNLLYRFLLDRAGVRGVVVRLGDAWRDIASRADYPPPLRALLGQALGASALLTGNIRFRGSLSLQLKKPTLFLRIGFFIGKYDLAFCCEN